LPTATHVTFAIVMRWRFSDRCGNRTPFVEYILNRCRRLRRRLVDYRCSAMKAAWRSGADGSLNRSRKACDGSGVAPSGTGSRRRGRIMFS
jgi:hypothetical protein